MFKEGNEASVQETLKSQFKGVFQNVSEVLDCISCQKCKLHGKMQLLGLGTALKILLTPEELVAHSLSRAELVALFNTLHKFAHSIRAVPLMSAHYYKVQESYRSEILKETPAPERNENKDSKSSQSGVSSSVAAGTYTFGSAETSQLVEQGIAAIAGEATKGRLSAASEDMLVDALLRREGDMLLLAKYYAASRPDRFAQHAARNVGNGANNAMTAQMQAHDDQGVDLIVIGGGLAGLSAALSMLDRGGRVVLLEKQGHLGGNSAWASSGVNAVDENNTVSGDSVEAFTNDTVKGAGRGDNPLIPVLTGGSVDALGWLRSRLSEHLTLDKVGQLGGHSYPRTHRPSSGLAGSAMVFAIQKQLEKIMANPNGKFELKKWTRAEKLITDPAKDGAVIGVEYGVYTAKNQKDAVEKGTLYGKNVLLATGGYASDYTDTSLLKQYRPDLLKYATTNNKGTTGDGHKLAMTAGAKGIDMDDVQVHPTGFHNPADPDNKVKTLSAEILRGEGGILLDTKGKRFSNELGTRDYVTGRMIETDPEHLKFALILNAAGAAKTETHIGLYTKKRLIHKFDTLDDLAKWDYWGPGMTSAILRSSMEAYDQDAKKGIDEFGKKFFHNVPFVGGGPYYAGIVTPVIHYCMGGLAISPHGNVLKEDGSEILGLHAAGEIIGGLHGQNRLGGNALSEALVFGRMIGERLPFGSSAEQAKAGPQPPNPNPRP